MHETIFMMVILETLLKQELAFIDPGSGRAWKHPVLITQTGINHICGAILGYKYTLFLLLSICFYFFWISMAPTPETGCESRGLETQKCFMNNLFVLNQNQANCHRWQWFGHWCGGNLFWGPVCLL